MKNKRIVMIIAALVFMLAAAMASGMYKKSPASETTEDKISERITVESGTFYRDETDESVDNYQENNDISSSGKLKIGYTIKDR